MTEPKLERGALSVRLHLFDSPEEELARAIHPPWPTWMRLVIMAQAVRNSSGAAGGKAWREKA